MDVAKLSDGEYVKTNALPIALSGNRPESLSQEQSAEHSSSTYSPSESFATSIWPPLDVTLGRTCFAKKSASGARKAIAHCPHKIRSVPFASVQ